MTAVSVHVPSLDLDPATRSTLVQTIVDTLPHLPNFSEVERAAQRDTAFALLAILDPRDPLQAMLVVHALAAHHASLHLYRCAARPDMLLALILRFDNKAGVLSRLADTKIRELRRLQVASALPASEAAASVAGPRVPQAPATAPGAPVRVATPTPRPASAAAGQQPGSAAPADAAADTEAGPGEATGDQLLAEVAARLAAAGMALAA
jgi:hypothetical protein